MPSRIMIRVDLESPIFAVSKCERRTRYSGGGKGAGEGL